MRHSVALTLTLTLAAAACGGRIAGETDPTETRITGTTTGMPAETPPVNAPPANAPPTDAPSHAPVAPPTQVPGAPTNGAPPFVWASSCNLSPPPDSPSRPPPTDGNRAAFLEALRSAMVGHWYGNVTTPWVATYGAFLSFEASGHYASRSLDPSEPAFYYGTDLDTDLKKWALTDLAVLGAASGTIDIAFNYGGSNFGLPTWAGELSDVTVDTAGNRLQLSFSTSTGYGPVRFDMWRCAQ
jgi:hypothetical protein